RVRDHVGLGAQVPQRDVAEHARVLGADGSDDSRWLATLQLRPLHPRKRNSPVQDAVGWPRGNAMVVPARRSRREWSGKRNAVSGRRRVRARVAHLAEATGADRHSPRTIHRSIDSMIGRRQLAVASPISGLALGRAFFASVASGDALAKDAREL